MKTIEIKGGIVTHAYFPVFPENLRLCIWRLRDVSVTEWTYAKTENCQASQSVKKRPQMNKYSEYY